MRPSVRWRLFLPCAAGVEALLGDEIGRLLPGTPLQARRGGVTLSSDAAGLMALNLGSRLAQRVLIEVAGADYRHEDDLYALAQRVDWAQWITPQHTLRVDTTAQRSPLRSLNFAALRIKDAVCDQLREHTGERPNVDTRAPDLQLLLHLAATRATLYVDASGESLFKRGWREDKGDAPLKETLAAAMLAAAGWRGTADAGGALHDPCCGAGTIAIEAAQIACGIAPGLKRRFAFERLLPFATPEHARADAAAEEPGAVARPCADGTDQRQRRVLPHARLRAPQCAARRRRGAPSTSTAATRWNVRAPALPTALPGTLMLNPPYGERIEIAGKAARPSAEDRDTPGDFFPRLAAHWKRAYTAHPAGWTAWVLSPDMKLPGAMRLKASLRVPLWNGPIECRLFRFDLVAGSARDQ